ncbi:MAG: CobW family GTP-binding protein [Pseudomonadota bacterium]
MILPITIFAGFLGAGKTTLVNQILRHASGRKIGVLVNEFGDLPIDADLIEARDETMIAIAGGCVCCTIGNDLLRAVNEMKKLALDHVIIEASGVSLPMAIRASLSLIPGVIDNGVICVIDAETIRSLCTDPFMGDTATAQICAADMLIISKIDLVSDDAWDETRAWLQSSYRALPLITRDAARADIVLGPMPEKSGSHPNSMFDHNVAALKSVTLSIPPISDPKALLQTLCDGFGIIRAKGFIHDTQGQYWQCHIVGNRHHLQREQDRANGDVMVFIGLTRMLALAKIENLLQFS